MTHVVFFFKQKTAYEMRMSDWSSDVCSSDLRDPDKLIEIISALEPTFGGINLEDIKAPECFYIERELRKRMKIPVFHDDQHGTAIIVGAAVTNGLIVVGQKNDDVKMVDSGAGAAALACVELLVDLGLPRPNMCLPELPRLVEDCRNYTMEPFPTKRPHK